MIISRRIETVVQINGNDILDGVRACDVLDAIFLLDLASTVLDKITAVDALAEAKKISSSATSAWLRGFANRALVIAPDNLLYKIEPKTEGVKP